MSLNTEPILRYRIINACIRNKQKPYPSMQDLIDACNEKLGHEFTVSTIQKDIKDMKGNDEYDRLNYKAPIKYSKSNDGYYYTDPDYSIDDIPLNDDEIDSLYAIKDLLQSFSGSRMSESFNHLVEKLNTYVVEKYNNKGKNKKLLIQTENAPLQRGFQYFEFFLSAIKKNTTVNFLHYSYKKKSFSCPIVHPYLLKEFKNRWYVIGYSESHKEIRTFGLDRINNPIELNRDFIQDPNFDPAFYLEDVYGVYPIKGKGKQLIEFKVSPNYTNYILAQPIHKTQKKVGFEPDGHLIFTVELIPSVELMNEFFANSRQIWVQKPNWIKDRIIKMLNESVEGNENN